MSKWESSLFAVYVDKKDRARTKARKTATRKLLLAPHDVGMHAPDAMTEQAIYFSSRPFEEQSRWIALHMHLLAFDTLAAHILPQTLRSAPVPQYRKVFLPPKVVSVSLRLSNVE